MKRIIVCLVWLCIFVMGMFSQPITFDQAQQVAEKFFPSQFASKYAKELQRRVFEDAGQPTMYAFSIADRWVLIAGDRRMPPILAYSDEKGGIFPHKEDMPEGMLDILEGYHEQIKYLRRDNVSGYNNLQWEWYLDGNNRVSASRSIVVAPLLTRNGEENIWKQGWNNGEYAYDTTKYYNKFCPIIPGCIHKRAVVGCVAVALGQIMWYWKWPYAAVLNNGSGDVVHRYDWYAMPAKLCDSSDIYNVDMVATLLRDCGASVNMKYGCDLSTALSIKLPPALRNVFGYNASNLINRRNYTDSTWLSMLKNELNLLRPVLYNGSSDDDGHQFVVDGYDSENFFHVNFGWGGSSNGYFTINDMIYNNNQSMIINVYPDSLSCDSLVVPSSDVWETNFILQNGGAISVGNRTITAGMHGCILSGESVTLTAGLEINEGAEVYIDIKDMHCGSTNNSITNRNATRNKESISYATRWKLLTNYFGTYGYPYWVEDNYHIVKDTIIGNYTYQLLNNKGAIRYSDDGMKFYYLNKSGEYLLCDFSLQVGDTCFAYIGTTMFEDEDGALQDAGVNLVQPWVVTARDVIDQRVHIKMKYSSEDRTGEFETEMIQGIGSHHFIFPLQTSFMFMGSAPSYTLCAFNGDENIYSFDLTEHGIKNDCPNWEMISKGVSETISLDTISTTKFLHGGQLFIRHGDKTYDAQGREIK